MDKYQPSKIESKWQKVWQKHKLYQAVDFDKKRPKKYLLVEFPYPSGEGLHIGHAFTNTILDVLARKKRMEGGNVLCPMGWDAFGLPTENYAIKSGIHPALVTKRNTKRFHDQDKRLAFTYDWDREINTTDPNYYRWTQWIFIQLFKHGLAYKAARPVGWCPACRIVLANEEIVAGKCERCGAETERRSQAQWLLRITAYADRLADDLDEVDYPDYVKAAQRHWIGRSKGTTIKFTVHSSQFTDKKITVFTTRPDTLFGTTAMVLAPEHPVVASLLSSKLESMDTSEVVRQLAELRLLRGGVLEEVRQYVEASKRKSELERAELAKEKTGVFTGLYCQNPINGEKVPIWVGDYVIASYGGGAVMVVPAHDQRDFEFAQRYNLPVRTVIIPSSISSGPSDSSVRPGLASRKARPCEVYEGEGILVNSGQFTGFSSAQARRKITAYLVKKGLGKPAVSYHLRDWIFSRQHYWGEPIPMIFCPACAKKGITWWDTKESSQFTVHSSQFPKCSKDPNLAGWLPFPEDQLPLKLPKVEKYQPTDTGESPLANVKDWVKTTCPHCQGPARRETDTMPNWAGSSWYYLAYTFGHKLGAKSEDKENVFIKYKKLLDYWLPVDIYLGGAEHTTLHLLYSRFWHKFLYDIGLIPGKEPYAARRQHGVILGEDGARMSKSRGNVINPENVVKEYGADTLRVYLMFMGPYEETMPWNTKGVEGAYRFLNRVWRLVLTSFSYPISPISPISLRFSLHRLIKKVTEDIDSLKYNTAIAAMMEFVNSWQKTRGLKSAKTCYKQSLLLRNKQSLLLRNKQSLLLRNKQSLLLADARNSALPWPPAAAGRQCALSKPDIQKFLLLLAPFAPFMTEELWWRLEVPRGAKVPQVSRARGTRDTHYSRDTYISIHTQPWPKFDPKLVKQKKVVVVIQVNGKLRGRLEVSPEEAKDEKKIVKLALTSPKIQKYLPADRQGFPKSPKSPKFIFIPGKLVNFVIPK